MTSGNERADDSTVKAKPVVTHAKWRAGEQILRFRASERLLHWSIALPFLLCAGSALALVVLFNPDPMRPYRQLFSVIHRVAGVLLLVLPPLVLLTHLRDFKTHLQNVKEGVVWTLSDFKWLALMPLSMVSKKVKLPEEGKFNAGEKMNFCMVLAMYPVMGASGVIIWLAGSALAPWLVHFSMAAAMLPLIGGHIFMATVNPASRVGLSGMFSGLVDRAWASHHYRRWFKENFEAEQKAPARVFRPTQATDVVPKADYLAARRVKGMIRYGTFAATVGIAVLATVLVRPIAARAMVPVLPGEVDKGAAVTLVESLVLSRPVSDASVLPGDLEKGTKVSRFGDFGPYSLVQDPEGRAGYVLTSSLGAAPITAPEAPASRETLNSSCVPASAEPDNSACLLRAEAAVRACNNRCAGKAMKRCNEGCQLAHAACVDSCTGNAANPAKRPARPLGWKTAAEKPNGAHQPVAP
jgi:formate dehydrogenase subunit gamma